MKRRSVLLYSAAALAAAVTACNEPRARVHYLGHAGWLVRTSDHALVFDHRGEIAGGDLSSGVLTPEELAGERVLLFVSHAHGDHFEPDVLKLRESVENLTVVLGWDEPTVDAAVVPPDAEWIEVEGAEVFALHHAFDGIPEGFFLVRSGGLTIFHSGDHGSWRDPPGEAFTANVDRLAAAAGRIDLAFVSSFGRPATRQGLNAGDVYSLRTLAPRVTFPMHGGGWEENYAVFAREAAALGLPTAVAVADAPGAAFDYAHGAVERLTRDSN